MKPQFGENPNYNRYETLLVLLEDLDAIGMNDSDEAEVVREEMDTLYYRLNEAEINRIDGLSADLYMLRNLEVPERLAPGETLEMVEAATREAWRTQNMEALLAALRKAPAFLGREAVASLRSYAYGKLGHHFIAFVFKRLAAELNPAQIGHRVELMDFYRRMGRWEEAFMEARFMLINEAATPEMRKIAAFILALSPLPAAERDAQASNASVEQRAETVTEQENRFLFTPKITSKI